MGSSDDTEMKTDGTHPANHLIHEKSPYLLQHAHNPVNWYPWGDRAFQKARETNKPVFLSIGYATCHWCHVMAHESFEDDTVARLLNQHFVSIKVDREERPDIDKIYMSVCQAMTGHGGWPLSVFITPEGKPFFSGTYFPKSSRMGMPGFVDVLEKIHQIWTQDPARILESADQITQAIQPNEEAAPSDISPDMKALENGYGQLHQAFDSKWGGFGGAPKFPTPHNLTFLLRWHIHDPASHALEMAEQTLTAMRRGGMFDQIGFGFHRYSVDEKWLVPHFEKMLYDQALLAMAYVEARLLTRNAAFETVAREIFTYVLRDMTDPAGGFYSAEDADSEGVEGRFYVWTPGEVKHVLGDDVGDLYCRFYDISEGGNFEDGQSIPHISRTLEAFSRHEGMDADVLRGLMEDARAKLFEARAKRVHPLKDDKVLTSWNGLMIAALAKASAAFGESRYHEAATRAARFILTHLRDESGRLLRRYRKGEPAHPAYLDDYAFMIWGLIELYEATFDPDHLDQALSLNEEMVRLFWDEAHGGFHFTGEGNEALITRSKEIYDGATPSGNSIAALNLLRLGRMTGDVALEIRAEQLIQAFWGQVVKQPMAYTQFLSAVDFLLGPTQEIVISGDPNGETTHRMIQTVRKPFFPNKVVLCRPNGESGDRISALAPYVEKMGPVDGNSATYVCEKFACRAPITDVQQLKETLNTGQ